MIISTAIFAAVGCFVNRVRGGFFEGRLDSKGKKKKDPTDIKVGNKVIGINKIINDVIFGILCVFLLSTDYEGFVAGVPTYSINDSWWWVYLLAHGCMWGGRAPGWGGYVGGIIDKVPDRPEFPFLDKLLKPLEKNYIARNVVGLSVRGLFWSACLSVVAAFAGTFTFQLLLCGLLMGPVYWGTTVFAEEMTNNRGLGWPWSEYVWGLILWGTFGFYS